MRAKQMPYKALPHVLIIWESLSKKKGRDRRSFGVKYTKHVTMLKGVSEQVYVGYGSSVKLSDLQKQLIRTVKENGGVASTEVLLEALYKIRGTTKIESIDKLLYVSNSSQQILLKEKPGYWKLNPTFDQLDVEEKRGNSGSITNEDARNSGLINSRNRVTEEEEESSVASKQHRYKPYTPPVSTRRKKEEVKPTSDEEDEEEEVIVEEEEESIEEEDEEEEEVKDEEEEEESEVQNVTVTTNYTEPTVLQSFILEVIAKHGGNTSKETIDRYIAKHWNSILKKDSSLSDTNYKDAILCDLGSTVQKQLLFKFSDNHYSISKFGQSFVSVKERESVPETSKLTGMQDILMRILLQYGGVCSFDQIYEEYIKSNNGKGTDYKRISRALLASLSHNPPGNFKKTTDGNSWMIAPKAVAIAEQMIRENPKYSIDKLNV